jgi:uncharacterized membrane protein
MTASSYRRVAVSSNHPRLSEDKPAMPLRALGHPLHVILIVYPLGLLPVSLIFDLLYLWKRNPQFAIVAYWTLLAGIVGALAAAVFGLIDWLGIPAGTRAKSVGLRHAVVNVIAVVLFAAAFVMRIGQPEIPEILAVILSAVGVAVVSVGGWLGGELAYRMGVGVDEGANLNSPSSLSGRAASERVTR